MEQAVGIPTTLFGGPPELGNLTKLANSQIGFMNIFAGPLFEAVTDILPPMVFAVQEIKKNQGIWKRKVENQKAKNTSEKSRGAHASEGLPSPRSGSPNRSPLKLERSHPEGLPASLSSTRIPKVSALSQSLDTPQQVRKGSAGSFGHLFGVPQPGSVSSSPDVSRRSSLGFPFGYSSPPHDSISFSRRSSGAFPGANIQNSNLSTRRSSNTMPSQLHIESASEAMSQLSMAIAAAGNIQPKERGSEDAPLHAVSVAKPNHIIHRDLRAYNALRTDGTSDHDGHRSQKSGSADNGSLQRSSSLHNHRATRHGSHSTSGPLSATSSHNRSSSGAQTNATQSVPYSPTGTLATSFLTVDSDDRSSRVGAEGWNSPASRSYQVPIDALSLESDRGSTTLYRPDISMEDITKGPPAHRNSSAHEHMHAHGPGRGHSHTHDQRVVTRKSSRFRLGFWRKKGKVMDTASS